MELNFRVRDGNGWDLLAIVTVQNDLTLTIRSEKVAYMNRVDAISKNLGLCLRGKQTDN